MVPSKVALIYVYAVHLEYLLFNNMFKGDFISRLYHVFLWLFSHLFVGKCKFFIIHAKKIDIYIFL